MTRRKFLLPSLVRMTGREILSYINFRMVVASEHRVQSMSCLWPFRSHSYLCLHGQDVLLLFAVWADPRHVSVMIASSARLSGQQHAAENHRLVFTRTFGRRCSDAFRDPDQDIRILHYGTSFFHLRPLLHDACGSACAGCRHIRECRDGFLIDALSLSNTSRLPSLL